MYNNTHHTVQSYTYKCAEEQLRVTLAEVDTSGTGSIGYTEFRAAVRHSVSVLVGGAPAANTTDTNTTTAASTAAIAATAAGSDTIGIDAASSGSTGSDAEAASNTTTSSSSTAVLEINNELEVPLLDQQQVNRAYNRA
jgi:hypothetical protein